MLFKQVDLTTALRPSLLAGEELLFVQDGVGLYQGRDKIPDLQQGSAYLTSLRVCYVDQKEPRRFSVGINLQDIDRAEHQNGFLKASAKVTLVPNPSRRGAGPWNKTDRSNAAYRASSSPTTRTASPFDSSALSVAHASPSATWVCPICTFPNPVPVDFDASNPHVSHLKPCQTCGVAPPIAVVLRAAIAAVSKRNVSYQLPDRSAINASRANHGSQPSDDVLTCPRCTYANSPYLLSCEMCGAQLANPRLRASPDPPSPDLGPTGPELAEQNGNIRISFRLGGDKAFFEKLKHAQTQKKWLLRAAPPIPNPAHLSVGVNGDDRLNQGIERPHSTPVGIAQLESRGLEFRKNNEVVIGSAFEDLEALMASAKEIVALAEKFAVDTGKLSDSSIFNESLAALGMVTTKDKMSSGSETLYLSELSRNLAEFLTDDTKGVLRREGGIMPLVDLWSVFNRTRNGVELISPTEFHKAAELWEKFGLPVRLRRFKSGLLVVQRSDWNDDKILKLLESWLQGLHQVPPANLVPWDYTLFGRGIDAQETAQRFGWSVGVATEELEMAEDRGLLCREESIQGVRYWSNHLLNDDI